VAEKHSEVVVALLAAGADANVPTRFGATSVWWGAWNSTANILQQLLDGGGSVNEPNHSGRTPLLALVTNSLGDAASRLRVLLARPELDLDVKWKGKTAQQWAVTNRRTELAVAIAAERATRMRWNNLRSAWISATAIF
jgi:ankyrin repeat protein